ncbi:MAG: DinB family protein [Cytophagaceae bacterium]|nr:DinB family protein [Cytophagaceae bacterium]
MHKPHSSEYPQSAYFSRYIEAVDGEDVNQVLQAQMQQVIALFENLSDQQQQYRYAVAKWSPKQILGHLTDVERIYSYRMLAIARGETKRLLAFEEDAYVKIARFDTQPLSGLVRQYHFVRLSTLQLLPTFDAGTADRSGKVMGKLVSVRALAWLIAGHERHHLNILRDRYKFIPPVLHP